MTITARVTEARFTPLDADGNPAGPTRTIPISSFTLHTTKENTAMTLTNPDDYEASVLATRPTKAMVTELLQTLRDERANARMVQRQAEGVEAKLRDAELGDLEAQCLDRCVRAIEAMRATEAERNRNRARQYDFATVSSYPDHDPRPVALGDPIGRILLHLAARYGQAIGAIPPPPPPERAGQQLVSVPAHVAEQLERMPMHVWEQHQ